MPMAAGPASPMDRMMPPAAIQSPDAFAKDATIAWFSGEFAAANAIIDALCSHLAELQQGEPSVVYDAVFAAIHRRRLNWIPVLQMQKYHSIADVTLELKKVAVRTAMVGADETEKKAVLFEEVKGVSDVGCLNEKEKEKVCEEAVEKSFENGDVVNTHETDSPDSDITDAGSQEMMPAAADICSNHENCSARPSQIKLTKGYSAKEQVKGHMVNVVKGLKLYEDVFTDSELAKLTDFVNELRDAGHNGELSGDTFILFNKQMKGNKKELIQLGVPIFGHIKEDSCGNDQAIDEIEPIPALLGSVIDHLVQWQLIPEYKKPNGCIINFFDEGEYSQPFLKPPHLEQPISTLLLSESTMAFGRLLVNDSEGNYKGPLSLSLKQGSVLVMRGNSADMARHVMCQSSNYRVSITFFKVRPEPNQVQSPPLSPQGGAMTIWQPGVMSPYALSNGVSNGYEAMEVVPKWGVLRAPVVMLAPVRPVVVSPRRVPRGGTGVFLPWNMTTRKPAKHLPPRAQKGRLLALPSPVEARASEPNITTEGKSPSS